MIRYIPKEQIKRLNSIAAKKRRYHLSDDCPILSERWNIPITLILPDVDRSGWVRCMIPVDPECEGQVTLDIRLTDYFELPECEEKSEASFDL